MLGCQELLFSATGLPVKAEKTPSFEDPFFWLLMNTTKGLEQDWSFARCAYPAPLLY